jgi:hypothetical protein
MAAGRAACVALLALLTPAAGFTIGGRGRATRMSVIEPQAKAPAAPEATTPATEVPLLLRAARGEVSGGKRSELMSFTAYLFKIRIIGCLVSYEG